jgi:hypothetical protein
MTRYYAIDGTCAESDHATVSSFGVDRDTGEESEQTEGRHSRACWTYRFFGD